MAVVAGLALAGCSEANAEDKESSTKAEIQQMAAVTEVEVGTCNKISDLLEKLQCENAALKAQRESKAAEIAAKRDQRADNAETIEKNDETNEQRNTRNDVLINEIGNQAVQESPQR